MKRARLLGLLVGLSSAALVGSCKKDSGPNLVLKVDLSGADAIWNWAVMNAGSALTVHVTLTYFGWSSDGKFCGPTWGMVGKGWKDFTCKDEMEELTPQKRTVTIERQVEPGETYDSGFGVLVELLVEGNKGTFAVYREYYQTGFAGKLQLDLNLEKLQACWGGDQPKVLQDGVCCGGMPCSDPGRADQSKPVMPELGAVGESCQPGWEYPDACGELVPRNP